MLAYGSDEFSGMCPDISDRFCLLLFRMDDSGDSFRDIHKIVGAIHKKARNGQASRQFSLNREQDIPEISDEINSFEASEDFMTGASSFFLGGGLL